MSKTGERKNRNSRDSGIAIKNYEFSIKGIRRLRIHTMKRYNIVQEKSYAFALEILRIAKNLRAESTDRVLINQLVRSGVPIGANVEEAIGAQ